MTAPVGVPSDGTRDALMPDGPREVVLLGSTGSIGTQALEVVAASAGRLRVVALGAGGGRPELLVEQARVTGARAVAVADPAVAARVREALPGVEVLDGPGAFEQLATVDADVVLNAVTGSRGLRPTLAALRAGRVLALANKESLVAGGPLVTAAAAPGQVVPVDSEHSALLQCLAGVAPEAVARLVLTASGGPFRGRSAAKIADATPEQALAHPTWSMGPVVTVNSATLVNKGLEVIEAHLLFGMPYERIAVVVHPQSVVHSMVELVDGSTLLQASPPDMRLPIAVALAWPERKPGVAGACDWSTAATWTFEPLDDTAFPAVALAREAGRRGGTAPAVFNAANEEAVAAFLRGNLRFGRIVAEVAAAVEAHDAHAPRDADDVVAAEDEARARVRASVGKG